MTSCTRFLVSGETSGLSLITRETVCVDTPATEATSLIVARTFFARIMGYNVIVPVIDNGNDNILPIFAIKSRISILLKKDLCHSGFGWGRWHASSLEMFCAVSICMEYNV